jgi:tol-pal system protein YbgF
MAMNLRAVRTIPVVFAALLFASGAAQAQLFGQQRNEESEAVARMGRLENQIRQLTGMIEELQHRQMQLENQLKRAQQDNEFRFQEMNSSGRPPAARGQRGANDQLPPSLPPQASRDYPPQGARDLPPRSLPQSQTADLGPPNVGPGRRGDAFDPSLAPDAPGVPRTLGSMPGGAPGSGVPDPTRRGPGTPLDLGSLANTPGGPAAPPPAAERSFPPAAQQQAVLAPSDSARDEYDLAFGAIQRRDYPLAAQGFRTFLANHSASRAPDAQRLVPEAHFWLGESQFQLKQYNDAAETFLKISTDYPNAVKAPDALLRLGQSLAALGERETACASLGHVLTKYPKASSEVKRAVEQEQKRVRC